MQFSELEEDIVRHVHREDYRPVKPRVIAKQLNLPIEQIRNVRRAVKRLTRASKLQYGANHLVYPKTGKKQNELIGRFSRAAQGYGFVRPQGTPQGVGRGKDVYVPQSKTRDAADGDTVLVRVQPSKHRGEEGSRGEILKIVERRTQRFVGTYFEKRGVAFVQIDGRIFDDAVSLGDPGAKNAKPKDKVVIEMVKFPAKGRPGEAVIIEVLGAHNQPGVDTLTIIREFALPEAFPESALEESRRQAEQFDESLKDGRRDFTSATVITIDPRDARDFDDAISLEKLENGNWRLGVHIADVAHFVPPGTPLDDEARERATSIYLPDRVIPMLPEVISNNLASLQPHKVRYAKSALMEMTPDGGPLHTELCSTAIRSDHRFTYEEVDSFLADRKAWETKLPVDVFRLLNEMHALGMILRKRRLEQGALEMSMPEVKVEFDDAGRVSGAHGTVNTESHQIIEEFMLAANIAVARHLQEKELLFLRRIHASPTPRKIRKLTEFVNMLGFRFKSLESRFELKKLLALVKGTPQQNTVTLAVLQSMQKAVYSPEPEAHYALATDCYCHFTSPIRRYPDLTIHRLIDALESSQRPVQQFSQLQSIADHCSRREQRAESAERELTKLKLLSYFESRIGSTLQAVVDGVESFGIFVRGVEMPVEGLIHVDSLKDDYYEFDDEQFALVGRKSGGTFRLGDVVEVQVAQVDLVRRELDFQYVSHISSIDPIAPSGGGHRKSDTRRPPTQGKQGARRPSASSSSVHGKKKFQHPSKGKGSGKPAGKRKRKSKGKPKRSNAN